MFDFDLQIFAEDEVAEEQTVETAAEETATDEPVAEEAATEPEEKEPIPDELDGLPEDVAREAMAEAAKMRKEEEPKEKQEEDAAEIDDSDIVKNQAIPYPRWKQKVAENAAMKEELESYKKRFGELNATNNVPQGNQNARQTAQQPMATSVPQSRPMPQMPQLQLTPDVMKQIEALKKQEALRMSGLTQEDLDGMDYMEENDPRRAQYQFALKMAEGSIMNRIQQAQVEQMRQAEQFLQAHDASVRAYNEAYTKAAAEPDFNDVVKYATEDYFYSKSPIEQRQLKLCSSKTILRKHKAHIAIRVKHHRTILCRKARRPRVSRVRSRYLALATMTQAFLSPRWNRCYRRSRGMKFRQNIRRC